MYIYLYKVAILFSIRHPIVAVVEGNIAVVLLFNLKIIKSTKAT